MNEIKILPHEIISKIAAGEVVERPASVLKELLENSIDAGSTSIDIVIKDAGKSLIQISDNGTGIGEKSLSQIFHRHATSKLDSLEMLYAIESLGFRGEALYSIAAVSDIILRTKTSSQDAGWQIHLRAQERIEEKPCPMHNGTHIEVKELFFNTPARKKFLKSNSTELNALLDIFIPYVLLYPGMRISFTHDNKKMFNLEPAQNLIQRIEDTLGFDKEYLIENNREFKENNLSIRLVLGDINIQRTRKDMQFIFVNKRPVQNRTIGFHINDIYRLLMDKGVYPFFCVFINMPPENLDVNVHPTKREIKIKNEINLIALLRNFTEQSLMTHSKAKQAERSVFTLPPQEEIQEQKKSIPSANVPIPNNQTTLSIQENILFYKETDSPGKNILDLKAKLQDARYLGNLLKKYLLFESTGSLLVIDQHAAHERINFEKLKIQIEKGDVEIQPLLSPILIRLSHQEAISWEENKETLEKMGFSSTLFDEQTLALHSHPQLIAQPEASVRNILSGKNISRLNPEDLARMACRSSVMAGDNISPEEAVNLKQMLLTSHDPFTCPHGRPTVIEISEAMLSKQFLRT